MPLTRQSFSRQLERLLPRLTRCFSHFEQNAFTRGEISLPQYWALLLLGEKGACSMHELAASLQIQLPSATGLVDRLVRLALVKRGHVPGDRRIVSVQLTAKGRQVITHMRKQKSQNLVRMFESLNSAEREQFVNIVEKLVRDLEKTGLS